jgi:hypothetical protein
MVNDEKMKMDAGAFKRWLRSYELRSGRAAHMEQIGRRYAAALAEHDAELGRLMTEIVDAELRLVKRIHQLAQGTGP